MVVHAIDIEAKISAHWMCICICVLGCRCGEAGLLHFELSSQGSR